MAKNMMPMSGGGSGVLAKLVGLTVIAAMFILVVKDPTAAGTAVRGAADAFVTFVSAIAG